MTEWKLVPVEPTEEMVEAHFAAHAKAKTVFADVSDIWHAMLAASPASPLSAEVEEMVGRLLKVEPDDGDEGTTCYYRNPDGHEAAALIRSLSIQLETALAEAVRIRREALEEAAKVADKHGSYAIQDGYDIAQAIRALGEGAGC